MQHSFGNASSSSFPGALRDQGISQDRVIFAAAPHAAPVSQVNVMVRVLETEMQQASGVSHVPRSGFSASSQRATPPLYSGQRAVSELASAFCTTPGARVVAGTPRKGINLSGRGKAASEAYCADTGSSLDRRRVSFLVDGRKYSYERVVTTNSEPADTRSTQTPGEELPETLRRSETTQSEDCLLLSTPRLSPRGFQNTVLPMNWTPEEQSMYDSLFQQLDADSPGRFNCIINSKLANGCLESDWLATGLRPDTLATIWQVANPDLKPSPCLGEWRAFCRLIGHCQAMSRERNAAQSRALRKGGGMLRALLRFNSCLDKAPPALPTLSCRKADSVSKVA